MRGRSCYKTRAFVLAIVQTRKLSILLLVMQTDLLNCLLLITITVYLSSIDHLLYQAQLVLPGLRIHL